jgi:peptidoglycan LD-endopeptidase LytH
MIKELVLMTVKRLAGIVLIISISGWTNKELVPEEKIITFANTFRQIQMDIRVCAITPDSARLAFQTVMRDIKTLYRKDSCKTIDSTHFVYPIRCYLPSESIGGRGLGFSSEGFDLFDMEAKGSHPAHDLFVHDKNQDNIDDRTWKPIDVLAFTSGVVLATETGWRHDSELRGGNWIWIYDPCLDGLFYYAHNNIVNVQPGQWVNAGDKISEMGRTGFNAYKKRSPTHLHLMFLKLNSNDLPEPVNTLDWLRQASVNDQN